MTSSYLSQSDGLCLTTASPDTSELCDLAVRGLVSMFDAESQLFCFRLKQTQHALVREGLSHRYTIIALLGLYQLEARGLSSPIDVGAALEALLRDYAWADNLGDVGLLLWLCALVSPERLTEVYSGLRAETALDRFRDARQGSTMELAWFLSGLAHANLALPQQLPYLEGLAERTFRLLINNQGSQGIFGHLARKRSLAGALRGHIGSFADQVYPIYAFTKFAEAYKLQSPLDRARNCAETISRAQGPKGQWWWLYNSSTGRVFQRHPVYSVHQHGMAPMALSVVGEASEMDFSSSVHKGLLWITATNELNIDLRVPSSSVIWRSIYMKKQYKVYSRGFLSLLGHNADIESDSDLAVRFECWSYELGWLLYAMARRRDSSGTLSQLL